MALLKGQEVWVNHSRNGIIKTVVSSSGKKYVTCEFDPRIKFKADTLVEVDYRGNASFIIEDIMKYESDRQIVEWRNRLNTFKWDSLNEDDLLKVIKIINEY